MERNHTTKVFDTGVVNRGWTPLRVQLPEMIFNYTLIIPKLLSLLCYNLGNSLLKTPNFEKFPEKSIAFLEYQKK